jgi:hypothetical protein
MGMTYNKNFIIAGKITGAINSMSHAWRNLAQNVGFFQHSSYEVILS